jgi:hypothetical protein
MKLIKNPNKLRTPLLPKKMSQLDVDSITEKLTTELTKHGGLGLSANQIGLTDRVCLINVKDPLILINPRVTETSKETVVYIEQIVKDNPNDMELGRAIRNLYRKEESYFKKHTHVKIYESPDKGNTVYERPFGGDITERKLVTNQLTIFDDEAYKESK